MFKFKSHNPTALNIALLLKDPRIEFAFQKLELLSDEIMKEHIRICEIPAPTFSEAERAKYFYNSFSNLGLLDSKIDSAGNVSAYWPRVSNEYICLSAHLDTVFPINTDCRVKKQGDRYFAPGISDNAAGLVGLLAIAKILVEVNLIPKIPFLFVATVGEEGIGDLKGAKYLFKESEYKDCIKYFISFDGPGIERITYRALGSKRYRITFKGSGGHSWGDFGIVNPIHAIGRAISKMANYKVPQQPATSYNVGIIEGGSSINTIAEEAQMQVDLRSISALELSKLENHLLSSVKEALREENLASKYSDSLLETQVEVIGERPSGEISSSSQLLQTAITATSAFGVNPYLDCSSTDANIPISLGLEAITLGAGGTCSGCHTLSEWYEETDRIKSLKRTLLLLLALSGLN
ncbi:MAG: M20/M25/M40 family metallo-hydrolase [Acidobacteria bacterium]|nr:M20/M25/M40 family metallo-hydrolase [Acidobacteriota bacterium]